jgi:hypothetical protein
MKKARELIPQIPKPVVLEVIDLKDIAYTHPVFLQCFHPTRYTEKNKEPDGLRTHEPGDGELVDPDHPNGFETRVVPAVPKRGSLSHT